MNRILIKLPLILSIIFSSFCPAEEEEVLFTYQPIIEDNCRISSKGAPLKDIASILIQERSNARKNKINDETYFTTAARRAEIPQMLARGEINDLEEVILKGRNPVLWVTVYRKKDEKLAMRIGMRSRDQEIFDPNDSNKEEESNANDTPTTSFDLPQSRLPSHVVVVTDSIPSGDFKQWLENNPTDYSGEYDGEVGGDSGGSLEINFTKGETDKYPPFLVNGTFKVKTIQSQASIVTFRNSAYDTQYPSEVNASAFKIFFVTLEGVQGVIVGDIFLPKK